METLPNRRVPARVLRSGMQFGFREGVDALDAVVNFIWSKIQDNMVVIAVSLDIRNAFNSLSWSSIRWALKRGFPGVFASRVGRVSF